MKAGAAEHFEASAPCASMEKPASNGKRSASKPGGCAGLASAGRPPRNASG